MYHRTSISSHRANVTGTTEANNRTTLYNNNKACVQWSDSVTSNRIKNINIRENMVNKFHISKDINVEHIQGIINPSNIFTK